MDKMPIHSIEAEMSVLGGILLDKQAMAKVYTIIDSDDFYDEKHKVIYMACVYLDSQNTNIDIVTLSELLNKRGQLKDIGNTFYITEILSSTPTAANVEYHARIVREKALKRLVVHTGNQLAISGSDESVDSLDDIDKALTKIQQAKQKMEINSIIPANKLCSDGLDKIIKMSEDPGFRPISTGYPTVNKQLGGFMPEDSIIIGARTSIGKTALMLNFVDHVTEEVPAGIFSAEMSWFLIFCRLVLLHTYGTKRPNGDPYTMKFLRSGIYTKEEYNVIKTISVKLASRKVFVENTPRISIEKLYTQTRRMVNEHGVKCIMADYMQLLQTAEQGSMEYKMSYISAKLKEIAQEFIIPVITLVQLNRLTEAKENKVPELGHIKHCDAISNDADSVILIHRPEFYGKPFEIKNKDDQVITHDSKNKAMLIFAKDRNNAPNQFAILGVDNPTMRYYELSQKQQLEMNLDEEPF